MSQTSLPESLATTIASVIREIRVPDLPYPVARAEPGQARDWLPMLRENWMRQSDQRVTALLASLDGPWTVQQVNSAYLADRIMDIFLRSSGLHPVLVSRLARLRYPLAWQLVTGEDMAFLAELVQWLDSFEDWRGWSDSGGRSARALLDQLDQLVSVIDTCYEDGEIREFIAYCGKWQAEGLRRKEHSTRLHRRLLETEHGAARQRMADQVSRAAVARALQERKLPRATLNFVTEHWLALLRQVAWQEGMAAENWRHASRLLEWMVWAGDPALSGKNVERLYQVGEQMPDKINEVWQKVWNQPPPADALLAMESVVVERLRGGEPATESAKPWRDRLEADARWLELPEVTRAEVTEYQGQWFVEGEGTNEQRRYFLAWLEDSAEVLWSNGYGVRLGLTDWVKFRASLASGLIRPLPPVNRFGTVLGDTVTALERVLVSQRNQRQEAAREARARAEQVRKDMETAELRRKEEEAARAAEAERQARLARERVEEEEAARLAAEHQAALSKAHALVDALNMGSWIALTEAGQERRLKLAVRINASQKLVFVDRLGLNRTELTVNILVQHLLAGTARILGATAEFDETLSRVVGRIRVGR